MESTVLGKGLGTPDAVYRNSEHLGVILIKFGQQLVVERHLVATHGAPIDRVEGQYDRPAGQIAQRELLIGSGSQR